LLGRLGILLVALIVGATAVATVWDYSQYRNLAIDRAQRELRAQNDLVVERLRREIHDRYRAVDLWPELEAAQDLSVDDLDRRLSASLLQLASSFGPSDLALGIGAGGIVLSASDAGFIDLDLNGSPFLFRLDHLLTSPTDSGGPGPDPSPTGSRSPGTGEVPSSPSSTVAVQLLRSRREEGLPPLNPDLEDGSVLTFSHRVTSRVDGHPLGWIVLLTSWRPFVDSMAQELGPELLVEGPDGPWYEGDSIRNQTGAWVQAVETLGGDIPEPLTVSLRTPTATVLASLKGAMFRIAALAALVLLAVVPPLLLLLRAALKDLRHLSRTATAMDPESPGSFEGISHGAPHEVRVLASSLSGMVDRLERSRKELARRESLAAVGVLAAGLAHEIRTPLSVLRASAEMLERGDGPGPREEELISFIQEEVARLARLVDDLLIFARPRLPELSPVDLREVGFRTERALASEASDGKILLETHLDPVHVMGDAEQLYQVGLNLVGNALHVSDPGSSIRISTHIDSGFGWLTVEDQGRGIDPEHLEKIWDPLFTTRSSGTGLGLAVVKRIVEAHRGQIHVENRPGAGAVFTVGIPEAGEDSRDPVAVASGAPQSKEEQE